jgi:hypothetical protein
MRPLIAAFGWLFGSLAAAAVYAGIVVLAKSLDVATREPDEDDLVDRSGGLVAALRPQTEEQRALYRRGAWILGGWALSVTLATAAWLYLKHSR